MKKIKIAGISIFITLALIASSFSIAAIKIPISEKTCDNSSLQTTGSNYGELEVIKEVFNGGDWTEGPILAHLGDLLHFRITITYRNNSGMHGTHWAYNISVNDTLPPCLDYVTDSADPLENSWSDDPDEYLYWEFNGKLYNNESYKIMYNATVVNVTGPEGEENIVNVTWDEHCTGGRDLSAGDILVITVQSAPSIKVVKEVWDPVGLKYVKNITTYSGDSLTFRINVSNPGFDNLTGVILNDTLPPFLDYLIASSPPVSVAGQNISWDLGTIPAHSWGEIYVDVTVADLTTTAVGKNFANVTADGGYNDSDNVTITVKQHIIVDKKVRHPDTGEWVDEIPYVKGCEPVRFRINITYYGDTRMKCLLVYDQLSQLSMEPFSCLEYADNVYIEIAGQEITPEDEKFYPDIYTEGDLFNWCEEPILVPWGGVYFSWINQSIAGGLENGESVIIEFDTNVTEYCEDPCQCQECEQYNCVDAWVWGCCDCCETKYHAYDCVNISCHAPPSEVNKTVWNPDTREWVDKLHTVQGYTIRFKIDFTYYGNEDLTNISVNDVLPCCLEYAGNSNVQPTYVSSDKKTIWWNVSQNLSDCETFTIEFDAFVAGASECGGCINYAYVYGYIWLFCETYELVASGFDDAKIIAESNSPPNRPDITGPTEGIVGTPLTYKIFLEDPDNNQMYYKIDWGDETTDWLGPVSPGEITKSHTWSSVGTYTIKAKAKDIHGEKSDWTQYPLTVEIKTAEITLNVSMFHFGKIKAIVENIGTSDLTGLNWEFNISRDSKIDFRDINIDGSGTIVSLPAGSIETIQSDSLGFKFGLADITVRVYKTGVVEKTATGRVFLIGPIALVFGVTTA